MPGTYNLQPASVGQAIDLFKAEFCKRCPNRFLVDFVRLTGARGGDRRV